MRSAGGADPEDGAADGVGCGNRYFGNSSQTDGRSSSHLGGKPSDWTQMGRDLRADCFYNAPSSCHRAKGHRGVAGKNDPPGDLLLASKTVKAALGRLAPLRMTCSCQK